MTEPAASTELTALFFFSAVHAGSLPEAQTLLARGVSINARDASDRTTLMVGGSGWPYNTQKKGQHPNHVLAKAAFRMKNVGHTC